MRGPRVQAGADDKLPHWANVHSQTAGPTYSNATSRFSFLLSPYDKKCNNCLQLAHTETKQSQNGKVRFELMSLVFQHLLDLAARHDLLKREVAAFFFFSLKGKLKQTLCGTFRSAVLGPAKANDYAANSF